MAYLTTLRHAHAIQAPLRKVTFWLLRPEVPQPNAIAGGKVADVPWRSRAPPTLPHLIVASALDSATIGVISRNSGGLQRCHRLARRSFHAGPLRAASANITVPPCCIARPLPLAFGPKAAAGQCVERRKNNGPLKG